MKSCLCGNGLNKENVIWTHLYLMTRSSVKCAERRRFAPSFIHFFTFYFWKPVFYYCCILEPSRRLREGGNEMLSPGLLRAFFFFFFVKLEMIHLTPTQASTHLPMHTGTAALV